MVPAILPGDWLVVSPLPTRWPRPGSVVVFREPLGETLAIKRVAARAGDRVPYAGGFLVLDDDRGMAPVRRATRRPRRRSARARRSIRSGTVPSRPSRSWAACCSGTGRSRRIGRIARGTARSEVAA